MPVTRKYSCVNCIYLQKIHSGGFYGDITEYELTPGERKKIKAGKSPELGEDERLRCYRDLWELDRHPEAQDTAKNLNRKRTTCKKDRYFYPYSPDEDMHRVFRRQEKERRKRAVAPYRAGGGRWKRVSFLLLVLVALQTWIILRFDSYEQFLDWLLSFFN